MISIENITKKYNNHIIFDDFSLQIQEGETTCILGESGAGKTTLLNILSGIEKNDGAPIQMKCAYVFQTPTLVPNLTVRENLKLICKDDTKIQDVLNSLGIQNQSDAYPITLSGGEAQRVALARALLFDSNFILLDEAFQSLDLKRKCSILKLFRDKLQGKTVLFVTHDIDEALYLSSTILVLKNGKIDCRFDSKPANSYGETHPIKQKIMDILLK